MKKPAKVLWGEGLFLRPQHFQRQDAYHEARLVDAMRALHPYAWGVRLARFDVDALATGTLRATELSIVFPDGEPYDAPGIDALPAPVHLAEVLSDGASETVFHAVLPLAREAGSNFAAPDHVTTATRYVQTNRATPDAFTDAAEAELAYLTRHVRLVADHEPRDGLASVPVARVRRLSTGRYELDARFISPSVSIEASPALHAQLRRLLDAMQAKIDALHGLHREPNKNIIEFRSGDIASFWLLHTLNAAFASLSHVLHHPGLAPERLYQGVLALAGSLLTFSKHYVLADLPAYRHDDPHACFTALDNIVRELLEVVISTRHVAIQLNEVKPSYFIGRLDSQKFDERTSFYLGVAANQPPAELIENVPRRFKLGSPDDVEKLVLSAMPGIRLTHLPQAPAAIPVRPNTYYFALDARGPLYERMAQAQSMMIYVPSGIQDLQLELLAVMQ
ncbi:MAG TPA: type VI secretion system baseplate subunit TssK [Burkholderiaceae bacterium]|nr:type VI secretion system baseplate subunit TssK [Burkholderiaceae bacterium]